MIPRRLKLHNFLSYRDCEIDFTPLRRQPGTDQTGVVVLAGKNGHGKSALLDAMTWAVWGRSRAGTKDAPIIHLATSEASVEFEFDIGSGESSRRYLILRKAKRKGTGGSESGVQFFLLPPGGSRIPLTGDAVRETEAKVRAEIHMDYDTFVSSAFVAQGRSNEFTIKTASQRKEVFRKILGLEQWEAWSKTAGDRRKAAELQLKASDSSIADKKREVEELPALEQRRVALSEQAEEVAAEHRAHEAAVQELRDAASAYEQLVKAAREAAARGTRAEADAAGSRQRLLNLKGELAVAHSNVALAKETRAGYESLAATREEDALLTKRGQAAQSFELLIQRADSGIRQERVRLETEMEAVSRQVDALGEAVALLASLEARCAALDAEAAALDEREGAVAARQAEAGRARQAEAGAKAGMERCRIENRELKEKQDQLEGQPECPLCRTPLGPGDVEHIRAEYSSLRKALGERFEAAKAEAESAAAAAGRFELEANEIAQTVKRERVRVQAARQDAGAKLTNARLAAEQLPARELAVARLKEQLATETFAAQEREVLARAKAELAEVEYDATMHESVRARLRELGPFDQRYQSLLVAEQAITGLGSQIALVEADVARCESEIAAAAQAEREATDRLALADDVRPRLDEAAEALAAVKRRQMEIMRDTGAVELRLKQLRMLEAQLALEESQLESKREEAGVYGDLESAFGRDGVQTLLIEQALPELEEEANRRLDQMTGGRISVQLRTQKEQVSGKLEESLEIRVSDEAGTRDYAMYSGGEAFRVDFALRIALARLLARRAGAELPTLIIDEGFGSQDAEGIDRLVEAINAISGVHGAIPGQAVEPFELILVVTHVEELRERFERRIEVTKDGSGSRVRVV